MAGAGANDRPSGDIIGRILGLEPSLSKAHRKMARAILAEPRAFAEKPIEELVPWLGVSAPTITRFCRTVGCEGLRDLKLKIMGSMRVGLRYLEPLSPPETPETLDDIVERVTIRAQRAVMATRESLDQRALERAAEIVGRSRMLYAFGGGGVSSWLIEEIQNRLFRLGLRVGTSADHQMQMMLAATVERVDAVICTSLTGNNQELMRAVRIAAEYGAPTIGLTVAGSPLAGMVDVALTVRIADHSDILGPTPLRYAFLAAIDALAYTVAVRDQRRAQETLRRVKQQFMTFRDKDDSGPVCD